MEGYKDLVFYYTGISFWVLFGVFIAVSLLLIWLYILCKFRIWQHRRMYTIMLSNINFTKDMDDRMKSFMGRYSKDQRRLIYTFIDSLKKKDFEATNEKFYSDLWKE